MAIKLTIRDAKGQFMSGQALWTDKALVKFASDTIKGARSILTRRRKRTMKDSLYNQMHYTKIDTAVNSTEIGFDFGSANDYWEFIDEGVQGTGYPPPPPPDKRPKGWKSRQGLARGMGSSYFFKYDSPGGRLVENLQRWVINKPVSLGDKSASSLAWAIGYTIKRRGLERTQFFTIPFENNFRKLNEDVKRTFRLDLERMFQDMPSRFETVKIG
jgi:hypothetical protein